jgi:iron complex outermembrane receptor protein
MRHNHPSQFAGRHPLGLALLTVLAGSMFAESVQAQEQPRRRGNTTLLEEVVVTARKREEGSQDVPLSITAFGSDQIEALKVRDLTNLSVGMPNVALDDVGTARGTANFSIRGLGISNSIPSIEPTVGVFINGIYLGLNNGILFDVFDLESIEVLRGPQGILFGRNVTGGAILLNTKKPGDTLAAKVRAAVDGGGDGGLNRYLMGSVSGPVTDTLGLGFTAYLNDDEGWHKNQFDGSDVQAVEQTMYRGTAVWNPTDRAQLAVTYERTDIEGDGPVSQSHRGNLGGIPGVPQPPGNPFNADEDSFDANYDLIGSQDIEVDFLSAQFDYDVDFGDGTITALYGWRESTQAGHSDIDAQPVPLFHAPSNLDAQQHSFELRYAGNFGDFAVNTGVYYFEHDMQYHERRELLGLLTEVASQGALGRDIPFQTQDGGGELGVETLAFFAAVDYAVNDRLTLTAGARYSDEEKTADILSLAANTNVLNIPATIGGGIPVYANPITGTDTRCNVVTTRNCSLDFSDSDSWATFAPKIGFSYLLNDAAQVYGHWSRGFRSGGYNLRNTSPTTPPGPFDEEQVDSFEIGYKSQQAWGRLNAAVFYNTIKDMQRDVNTADPVSGIVQVTANTADATIWGLETDLAYSLTSNLLLLASVGYINASYDDLLFDINGAEVPGFGKDLDLPRAPEWTYSVGLNYDIDLGSWGYASTRVNYAYRDQVAWTDDNRGIVPEQDIVDAGIDIHTNDEHWVFSLYGRNLLNTVKWGGDSQLPLALGPIPLGGAFAPLAKGRVVGAEVTYSF